MAPVVEAYQAMRGVSFIIAVTFVAEIGDVRAFAGARPKGLLRVEVQGTLARHFLLPGLPTFSIRTSIST